MHDIDRTQMEFDSEFDEFESDQFEFTEELETYGDTEMESPLDEVEEMELAAELLGVTDEAELDQFLGKSIKRVGRAARRFVRSPVGNTLGGILKGAAKKYLPILGGAAGTFFGGPAGAALGSQLASKAGSMFGLELEGLSPEDQEFEVAKQFVRFAGAAANEATTAPPTSDPQTAAKTAVVKAAKRFAPGLLRRTTGTPTFAGRRGRGGRWIRRGRKIILFGV